MAELIDSFATRELSTPWFPAHNILADHKLRRRPGATDILPEDSEDRCYEYLKAHANILHKILHQND